MNHFHLLDTVQTPFGKGSVTAFTKSQEEVKVELSEGNRSEWFKNSQLKSI